MTRAEEACPASKNPRPEEEPAERVQVYGVTWNEYLQLVELFAERHVRLTYDGWTLEMAKSTARHERRKILIGGIIDELASAWDIPLSAFGGATFHREDLKRGIDPDLSYYRPHSGKVVWEGRSLKLIPPPDLVVELDVTDATEWRLAILAAFGAPEVWRFDGRRLTILTLQNDGYVATEQSPTFPLLNSNIVASFMHEIEKHDEGSDRVWRMRVRERAASLNSSAGG